MEKIGYDLDGVLATNLFYKADYRPYRLNEFYKKANATNIHIKMKPNVIITGRRVRYKKLTEKWLADSGINYDKLIMFPNNVKKNIKTLAEFKAKHINKLGITQFFEEDEGIAELLFFSCPNSHIFQVIDIGTEEIISGPSSVIFKVIERVKEKNNDGYYESREWFY